MLYVFDELANAHRDIQLAVRRQRKRCLRDSDCGEPPDEGLNVRSSDPILAGIEAKPIIELLLNVDLDDQSVHECLRPWLFQYRWFELEFNPSFVFWSPKSGPGA